MASNRYYNEEEAEQILKLAAANQGIQGPLSRERLIETAAELGISPQAVEAAEQQFALRQTHDAEMREFVNVQRRGFYSDFTTYLIVNGFFVGQQLLRHGNLGWTAYMLGGWGIGIAFHARSTFDRNSIGFRRAFDQWKARQKARE
ncbi:MAG: 2TM domain-containing protein [Fimbriimonas ginsengisoli]|uniref:2TM domain-containing protein n=1 Tax=Fimbriimonas ginsengisoli TaxID=1005039 RepID=A0A931LYA5_FIMGI|nr:2TM domain-containing protein [Fimbriimonas ginsengisoli]